MTATTPRLHEPWQGQRRQRYAATVGMWLFLGSEALLFGGMLVAFLLCRSLQPEGFATAAAETDIAIGTANTLLLLTSSAAVAVGAEAARQGLRRWALPALGATLALGLAFLVLKGFEWRSDILGRLWPGPGFRLHAPGSEMFFAFYWALTGLHAAHMVGGLGAISWFTVEVLLGRRSLRSAAFEAMALYWHLIDIVWVFLFPLLYLDGRSGA